MPYPTSYDKEYIMRDLHAGDIHALQYILDQFYPTLCYFANRLTHNKPAAELIAEETICRLWENRQQFTHIEGVVKFLYTHACDAGFSFVKTLQPGDIQIETTLSIQREIVRAEVLRNLHHNSRQQ